ncbi:MAG TPA: subclass B3 metallo-beta-lactamase [Bryobacteraceae bacterium]|nr:subclass B3 metallo-beta-lactamase [Bryobacteraceae bacterium]
MLSRVLALLSLSVAAFAQQPSANAQRNPDWFKPFPPFKIIGNIYWVGTWDLSTYLITTSQGNILINTGFPETLKDIKSGVEQLGFKLSDTKILMSTHGHSDHVAAMAELKRMTGARMLMMEQDAVLLEDGGKSDFRFGDGVHQLYEPVKVDQRLKNGDKIKLGDVEITAHHHPGHTKGATSYSLTVRENGRDYRVLIANMPGINPGVTVSGMPKYPAIATDYARSFHDMKELQVDVWLASHAAQFNLHDKYKPGDAYDPNRFVDPQGYRASLDRLEKLYRDQLAQEQAGK